MINARAQVSLGSAHTAYLPRFQAILIPAGAAVLLWLLLWRWFELRAAKARAAALEREQAGGRERSAVSS